MKYIIAIFTLLLSHLVSSQPTWTVINSEVLENLHDIHFTSYLIGYISGENGTLLKTIDGGLTWNNISINSDETIKSMSFINDNVGYLCTPSKIYKTIDGGENWIIKTSVSSNTFNLVKFINEDVGFIGTDDKILRTIDGIRELGNYP